MKNILKILSLFVILGISKNVYSMSSIYFQLLSGPSFSLNYAPNATVSQMAQEISFIINRPVNSIKLVTEGRVLNSNDLISSTNKEVFFIAGVNNNIDYNKYISAYNSVYQALDSKNTANITNAIENLRTLNPDAASNLFQNGNALDYDTLSSTGFTDTQIAQIAQAGGVAQADLNTYLNGKYTGAGDLPPVVPGQDPTNPINTGTGNQAGEITPAAAQEYYQLKTVTAENLQLLITQNQLTRTEFNQLIANQEANLEKLKESGTATEEEVAEYTNEVDISKQVAANPETKFAPESVDPVVAP